MKRNYSDKTWTLDKIEQCSKHILQNNMIIFKMSSNVSERNLRVGRSSKKIQQQNKLDSPF